ncbi:MAG: hypothetical protein ACRELY_23045 [Polyangiaceae bacterium]
MRRLLAALFALLVVAVYAACGTDAQGVETCRKIETARCQAAPGCKVSLANPPHPSDDVQGCIDFYHDACLHGLEVNDPGGPMADGCVKAILGAQASDPPHCDYVLRPELAPACMWLVPAATPVDAGEDADDGAVSNDDASDAAGD